MKSIGPNPMEHNLIEWSLSLNKINELELSLTMLQPKFGRYFDSEIKI